MLSGKVEAMPRSPSARKRPTDAASNAVHVMRIATGELPSEAPVDTEKNAAAVALGRLGGKARAKVLSKRKLRAIAKTAAKARWK